MKVIISHIRTLFLLLVVACAVQNVASAQIEVAPTRVMLSMRERSQEVNVTNPSENSVEINTELGYKLIRSDSLGSLSLDSATSPAEQAKSGRDWLKIFPRRFTLAPRSSRVVRVMVTIPDGVDEGEYWGRLLVTGTPVGATIPVDGDSTQGIETKLTMRMQLDLPVIIRKGEISTGIDIGAAQGRSIHDTTVILLDLNRVGNSAYRGTINAALRDMSGREVVHIEQQFTAEFMLRMGLHVPLLADGNYTLEVEARSVKKGSANDAVIPAAPVRKSYRVSKSGSSITITE